MPVVTDWPALVAFCEKQALIGICLPEKCPNNLPQDLLYQWIGHVLLIEQQNIRINERVEQLLGMFEKDGFQCCLLKGQGNSTMYPNPLRRFSGDIDVWIDTKKEHVYQYVICKCSDVKETYKHIHFPVFEDAQVDVHVDPLILFSIRHQRRLRRWIDAYKEEQFNHRIRLPEISGVICVPTLKFNVTYQLGHMLVHLFDEGLGLRHVVDYFYLLSRLEITEKEREELVLTVKSLGMYRFARAIMWVESFVLGLPVEQCIVEPSERLGKQLLEDILEGGDFGHYSKRYRGRTGFYYLGFVEAWRDITLVPMAPREGIARLFSKIRTAVKYFLRFKKTKQ